MSKFKTEAYYTTEAYVKIPDNYKYPLATSQATKYQKETNTGGLVKLLILKVGS